MTDNISSNEEVATIVKSVCSRSIFYLAQELHIDVVESIHHVGMLEELQLIGMTAIIGMGGRISMLIAASFEEKLINHIYAEMTRGLNIRDDEVDMYREAAAGDFINAVLGQCTFDLQTLDNSGITLTPPIILNKTNTIKRANDAVFLQETLISEAGTLAISFIGPRNVMQQKKENFENS